MNDTQNNAKLNTKQRELVYPELSYIIQDCVFDIRKQYGPGQKEVIYQRLLKEKLESKKLKVEQERKKKKKSRGFSDHTQMGTRMGAKVRNSLYIQKYAYLLEYLYKYEKTSTFHYY